MLVTGTTAYFLYEAGVSHLSIQDLDKARQQTLIATLRGTFPAMEIAPGVTIAHGLDILVNATPVGMNREPRRPLSDPVLAGLTARGSVAKVVTAPTMTSFQTGLEMTETQLLSLAQLMLVSTP